MKWPFVKDSSANEVWEENNREENRLGLAGDHCALGLAWLEVWVHLTLAIWRGLGLGARCYDYDLAQVLEPLLRWIVVFVLCKDSYLPKLVESS